MAGLGSYDDYETAYANAQPLADQLAGKVAVAIEKAKQFGRTVYGVKFMPWNESKRQGWELRAEWVRPMKANRTPRKRKGKAKRKPKRKNPDLVTISNPAGADVASAVAAYRQFHGVNPTRCSKGSGKGVLIALGELREIVYQPKRGQRKGPAFFHKFKAGNVLAVTADGKRLVIVDRSKRKAVDFDLGIIN